MPAHKLQGKLDFQGLPISIENKKGSVREWYDPQIDKHGETKMKYPYGYVKGTLGLDGDAVDVFIGPNEESTKVFVITQKKAPDFKEVDEQKVMLGFDSGKEAKAAYMEHYDKPGFFGSMKEITLDEFKDKLSSLKGKLIKSALSEYGNLGKIEHTSAQEKGMTTAIDDLNEFRKALTAMAVNGFARRARMLAAVASTPVVARPEEGVPSVAGIAEPQPLMGTNRVAGPGEPPVVPVRMVYPDQATRAAAEVYKSCNGCGRMNKSMACITCDAPKREAIPVWRR